MTRENSKKLINSLYLLIIWCPGPESNRYGDRSPTDFKSVVSTNFTTRADVWRCVPESNRANWICNPGHNRFANAPCFSSKNK